MILMPSSLVLFRSLADTLGVEDEKGEPSTSIAGVGWMACSRRRVETGNTESPRYLTSSSSIDEFRGSCTWHIRQRLVGDRKS